MTCENFFSILSNLRLTSPFFFQMLDKQTRVFHSPLTFIPCLFPRFLVRLGSLYCLYEEVMQSKNEGENGCWQQCRGWFFLLFCGNIAYLRCVCAYIEECCCQRLIALSPRLALLSPFSAMLRSSSRLSKSSVVVESSCNGSS